MLTACWSFASIAISELGVVSPPTPKLAWVLYLLVKWETRGWEAETGSTLVLARDSAWVVWFRPPGGFSIDVDAEDGVEDSFGLFCFPSDLKKFKLFRVVLNLFLFEIDVIARSVDA